MLNSLHLWSVNHLKLEANVLAHRLAKKALFLMDKHVHMKDGSHYTVDLVIVECNNL
jgi:hypothetical protein